MSDTWFSVNALDGAVLVKTGVVLNADSGYPLVPTSGSTAITVTVTDAGLGSDPVLTDSGTVTITVTDVNEPPRWDQSIYPASGTIAERVVSECGPSNGVCLNAGSASDPSTPEPIEAIDEDDRKFH